MRITYKKEENKAEHSIKLRKNGKKFKTNKEKSSKS